MKIVFHIIRCLVAYIKKKNRSKENYIQVNGKLIVWEEGKE